MNWFLKKADGAVYGPVDMDTLRTWATDGRVFPDDQISADDDEWIPAPSLPDLKMDWLVSLTNGEWFGPVHLLAVRDLIDSGAADAATAVLVHKDSREELPAGPAVLRALMEKDAQLQRDKEELAARVQDLDQRVRSYETVFSPTDPDAKNLKTRVQRELKSSLDHRDAYEREAIRWRRLYDDEREKNARREAELAEQVRRLRDVELISRREIEALAARIRDMEKGDDFITKVQVVSGSDSSAASVDSGSLLAAYKNLSRNYDKLVQELAAKSAEIHELLASRTKIEHAGVERVRLLEENLRREQAEAESARRKLIELEEEHLQFVQAYRDLNDRYIRSRQQSATQPPAMRKESPAAHAEGPRIRLV